MLHLFKSKKGEKKDKEVSLVVEATPTQESLVVKVSRSALTKHSAIFKKMSENGAFRKSREVKLKDISVTGLQKMIDYIKKGIVFFQTHYEAIDTLKAAYLYQVMAVYDICSDFLLNVINCDNVCEIYEFASSYSFHQVEFRCLKFIDLHAGDILKSSGFLTLKKDTVCNIIKRQTLDIPEGETSIFQAVLTWGLNDCMRRGADSENLEELLKSVKPLLAHVRFGAMSEQEISDPKTAKFYRLLTGAEDIGNKRRTSVFRSDSISSNRSSTFDPMSSTSLQQRPRLYLPNYEYNLEMLDSDAHSVRNGEIFYLKVEVLKGRVFLTGTTLAFERFISTKGNSCLYLILTATNMKTNEQVCARGAFMFSGEEAMVKFPTPLMVKESEKVEMSLQVKRAINVCSMLIKGDCQIAVPEGKEVALKIVPFNTSGGIGKSMFKGVKYFF